MRYALHHGDTLYAVSWRYAMRCIMEMRCALYHGDTLCAAS
ncbi:hypothetical protein Vi05172_g12319 [Venturia inaequalis]|nr:hypothetical protein Vi05172_g12319 [Venturia inaequalis]